MKHVLAIIALSVIGLALAFGQGIGGKAAIGGKAGVGGGPSGGAIPGFAQIGQCFNNSTTSCTITLTVTGGDALFFVGQTYRTSTFSTPSDGHNTYNVVNALANNGTNGDTAQETWIATGITAGSTTITCTNSATVTDLVCYAIELSNVTASPVDQTAINVITNTTAWTTNATSLTSQANEILISCGGEVGAAQTSIVAGGSWIIPAAAVGSNPDITHGTACEYQVVSVTGTYSGSMTASSGVYFMMQIATLK